MGIYDDCTVTQLRTMCKDRRLITRNLKKQQLIDILIEDDIEKSKPDNKKEEVGTWKSRAERQHIGHNKHTTLEDKIKARRERFGSNGQISEEQRKRMLARRERFGQSEQLTEEQKLRREARKMRFGGINEIEKITARRKSTEDK